MEDSGGEQQDAAPAVADALLGALRGTVPKADMYLIKAAQSTTLKHLRSGRKLLRDFNAASQQQLAAQAREMNEAVQLLGGMRADLDYIRGKLRAMKQHLAAHHPELYAKVLEQEALAASAEEEL